MWLGMTLCIELITLLNQVNSGLLYWDQNLYVFAAGCEQLGSVQKRKIDTFYIDNPAPITKSKSYQEKFLFTSTFYVVNETGCLKKNSVTWKRYFVQRSSRCDLLRRSWLNPSWIIWQIWLSSYNNSENVLRKSHVANQSLKAHKSKLNHCPLFGYHVFIDRLDLNYGNVFYSQSTALFLCFLTEEVRQNFLKNCARKIRLRNPNECKSSSCCRRLFLMNRCRERVHGIDNAVTPFRAASGKRSKLHNVLSSHAS